MAKVIEEADEETRQLVRDVLAEEYPGVAGLDPPLRIGVLFVSGGKPGKPALTHGGYPAAGTIRVVGEEDRAAGGPDVIVSLDLDAWPRRSADGKRALVQHELHHIVPKEKLDSLGRQKVGLRKHDFEIGGFRAIVERYGDDAIEWQQVKRVHDAFRQMTLPFVAAPADDPPRKKAAR